MKAKNNKELIVSLIQDDLVHAKLIYGLLALGLKTEGYFMDLSDTIVKLMGFEGEQNEQVFMHYLDLQKQAKFIDVSESSQAVKKLAHDIYYELQLHKSLQ